MNWNDLKYFLVVSKIKNITDASLELGVSPSTVSRRISEIESHFGLSLFNKRQNGYFLTDAAENILSLVEETERNIKFIERKIVDYNPESKKTIKIDLPELLGQYLIFPALKKFQETHSSIKFDVSNDIRNSKLATRSSDIVVRMSMPSSGAYKAKKIGEVSQSLFCSKNYFNRFGSPKSKDELINHYLIGWDDEYQNIPLSKWFLDIKGNAEYWIKTSNFNSQLQAVRSGLGIGVLPHFINFDNTLVPVLDEIDPLTSEIWLLRNIETQSLGYVGDVFEFIENVIKERL